MKSIASYLPLQRQDSTETDAEDTLKQALLEQDRLSPEPSGVLLKPPSKWVEWVTLGLSILVMVCACSLYISSAGIVDVLAKKKGVPTVIFPSVIVRANKAMPDKVYKPSPHVVLSDVDSMFFQWHMKPSPFTVCYIDAIVPSPEEGLVANKTYTSAGAVSDIQVWNVTAPVGSIDSMSWNTRPERIALLGTVSFIPDEERNKLFAYEDGWQVKPPTPKFTCGATATYTVEVACSGCELQFYQVFSTPRWRSTSCNLVRLWQFLGLVYKIVRCTL